jgi:signal transduction histidine kinase
MLVRAGQALGASLDFEETLGALARVALPALGDLCIVDVIEETGARRVVAVAPGTDPDIAAGLQAYPVDPDSDNPIARVIRSGRPLTAPVDSSVLDQIARDNAHRRAAEAAGLLRILVVPLWARGRAFGGLMFGSRDPHRSYGPDDVTVAEVLGQRAAKAVENARLHREVARLAAYERQRAAELDSVLAAIGEGIILFDGAGAVRSMNDSAVGMLKGRVSNEAELRAKLVGADDELHAGASFAPVEYELDSQPRRWLELTGHALDPTPPQTSGASVLVLRDVTAFRQGQGLREAFLGLLSHELRTPVTSIYAGATVLNDRGNQLEPGTRQEILSDVVHEADRLYRLTEDLMVLARFDENIDLVSEPSLLQRVIPPIIASEQRRWPSVEFVFRSDPGLAAVSGDDTSIQQIVRNLLSNAAKYGPIGQQVEVDVSAHGEGVTTRVLDRGHGLGGDTLQHLFSPFFRAPTTAAVAAGAGIGLYACKRLVDAMAGRMWALPRKGGGSEFGFWLPYYESMDPAEADAETAHSA